MNRRQNKYTERQIKSEKGLQAKVKALWQPQNEVIVQSASGEELSALMPSVLDKAFKGEL